MSVKDTVENIIQDYFDSLDYDMCDGYDVKDQLDAAELASDLEGLCSDPYTDYRNALTCPINKRGEKDCKATICNSYEFCHILRQEGYIRKDN